MDHIKGNWRIATEQADMLYIEEDHGRAWNNPTICLLYQDITPTDSVGCIDLEALPNAAANARLIAAAPELLAALEDLLGEFDENEVGAGTSVRIGKARAAIARARGVSA
jgi:hypothetical protein